MWCSMEYQDDQSSSGVDCNRVGGLIYSPMTRPGMCTLILFIWMWNACDRPSGWDWIKHIGSMNTKCQRLCLPVPGKIPHPAKQLRLWLPLG